MNFWQAFIEALESLTSNKLRSGLTILGIVIGVGAVIAMLAIGTGAENSITGEIQGIGSNLIFVFRGGSEEVRNPKPLTLGDADALADPFAAPSIFPLANPLNSIFGANFAETTPIVPRLVRTSSRSVGFGLRGAQPENMVNNIRHIQAKIGLYSKIFIIYRSLPSFFCRTSRSCTRHSLHICLQNHSAFYRIKTKSFAAFLNNIFGIFLYQNYFLRDHQD